MNINKRKKETKRKVINNENNPEKGLSPVINNSYIIIMYSLSYFKPKTGITMTEVNNTRNNRHNASLKQEYLVSDKLIQY
jgi:hypothetical protein